MPLFAIITLACLSVGAFLVVSRHYTDALFDLIEARQRSGLIQIISIARNAIEPVLEEVRSGKVTREEAIQQIRPLIRSMTYRDQYGKNYIVMNNYEGVTLVHPYEPEKEMKNELDLRDAKGVYIVRGLISAAKTHPEGSFIRYYYYLPQVYETQEKITYVIGIPEIECYIATGMYIQNSIQEQKAVLNKFNYASTFLIIAVFIPLLTSLFIIVNRNRRLQGEIRARKETEGELKQSELKYREIFENTKIGLFQTGADGRLISLNPAFARINGYNTAGEMLANTDSIGWHYADPDGRERLLRIINEKGFVDDYLVKMKRKDGILIWVSISARAVKDEKGNLYYEGSVEDITIRKEAEDAVITARKMLDDILRAASEFVIVATDSNGIITVFNRGAEQMLGYSADEIIGKHTPLILHDDLEVAARGRELTAKLGYTVEGFRVFTLKPELEGAEAREWTYKRKDGSSLPVSLVVSAIRSEDNEFTGYLGIATDLTTRKKTEVEIRRLASIVRHSSELISLAELDGQMVFINNAGSRMLGIDPGDIERINVMQLIPEPLKRTVENDIIPMVLDSGIWEGDMQYINLKTGAVTDVHSLTFTIDDPNALYKRYLVNVSHDISERKQAEEKFTNIFMMAPDGISITRMRDGLIVDANLGFGEISGWTRSEAIGKTSLDINFWADPADRAFLVDELTAGRDVMQRELRFRRKDGSLGSGIYSARSVQLGGEACLIFVMQDITKRKETESILRENEDRLSRIATNLPGVVFQFLARDNGDWKPTYNSQRMTEIFGLSVEAAGEFTAFLSRVHEEDRERFTASIRYAGESCTPWNFEGRFIKPSGETIWFHGLSTPTRHEGFTMFDGILLDVTESKKAEEALRISEEKFIKVFMMSPDMMAITRMTDGLIAEVNMGFEEITGWKREEVIGKTTYSLNFWSNPADRASMVKELETGIDVVHREVTFRRKDGTLRTGIYSARFIEIAKVPHLIFVMKDITERIKAEEMSRLSEEKFTKVFMTSPNGIAITSMADGRFLDVNIGFEEMTGWKREELLGHTSLDINFWCDLSKRAFMADSLDAGRDVLYRELQFRRKDGVVRTGIYSAKIIHIAGETCIIFILEDISDRKHLEEERRKLELQLNRSQKMDAIGKLAGGIAHDFNNILMGIQGSASMSMMEFNPGSPHYLRMSRIEEHVKRGANLTRQLLGFAREGKYELRALSMNDLLRKSAQFFAESRKEIEVDFQLQEDLYNVEVDAGQMEQVFLNIFINAGHAMPNGGRIHIQTANTAMQEKEAGGFEISRGDYIRISISDTGTGMDAKTLEKIFEPFFTTKAEQGGTGLGLASAYGIIRNHGGAVNAYSEPGHGTTFNIYLPSSNKTTEEKEDRAADRNLLLGSGGILIVDDESSVLELASDILKMLGYTVYQAENAQAAVSTYRERREGIDLIILDMILRGTSGAHVLKMLKEINPEVKVILSSGYSLQGEVRKVMEMGCVGFIQKPYNFADLSRVVHNALKDLKG